MALQLFAGSKKCLNILGFCVNFPGKYNHFFCIIVSAVGHCTECGVKYLCN